MFEHHQMSELKWYFSTLDCAAIVNTVIVKSMLYL